MPSSDMSPDLHQRRRKTQRERAFLLLGLLAALGLALGLILYGFGASISLFLTPKQVEANVKPGEAFRLGGLVAKGTCFRVGDLDIKFDVTDGTESLPVIYHGILPDLFREGQGVVADGSLNGEGTFVATGLLAKHDETYIPREIVDKLKDSGEWRGGAEEPEQFSGSLTPEEISARARALLDSDCKPEPEGS